MPYGIPKDKGGHNPANEAKMKACVERVMSKGTSKLNAILICKSSLFGDKRKGR